MARRWGEYAAAVAALAATPALAQTDPQPQPAPPAPLPGITVTATRLDDARGSIQPSLGASRYEFTPSVIAAIPLGEQAPLNQVLLRAPGVAQDSFGQIHVRGDHGNVQYRLDGVQLPEGLSLFNNALATQYCAQPVADHRRAAGAVRLPQGRRRRHHAEVRHHRSRRRGDDDRRLAQLPAARLYLWRPLRARSTTSSPASSCTTASASRIRRRPTCRSTTTPTSGTGWARSPASSTSRRGSASSPAAPRRASRSPTIPARRRPSPWPARPTSTAPCSTSASGRAPTSASCRCRSTTATADFQLSGFARYSSLAYKPDPFGDLMFNGIAPWANRTSFAAGVQGDGSWKVARQPHAARRLPGAARARHQLQHMPRSCRSTPPATPTSDQAADDRSRAPTTSAGCTASTCRTSGS